MELEEQFNEGIDHAEVAPRDLAVELFNVVKNANDSVGRTLFKVDGSRETVSVPFEVKGAFTGYDVFDFSIDLDGLHVEALLSPKGVMQMHVNGEKVQGSYDSYLQQILEAVARA